MLREAEDRLEMKRKLNAVLDQTWTKKSKAEQAELQDFLGIGAFLAGVTAIAGAFCWIKRLGNKCYKKIKDAISKTKRVV